MSHTETAEIVAKSFFSKDESTLKKHTTSEGYASLITVQNMLPDSDKEIEVEIIDEAIDGEIAWVRYKTSYDGKTGIFKLVKENDQWKVTNKGPREKGSF
ncbi:nuclear transport factor 2 family protein [Lacinutrix neustonica]|uniref:Nuclear transport factor 2 family protein n=1 Tax=Lacinutrix neustonica TaxID=2980107 RepID=A0A9E8MU67_9FLAO|nr:nuclear transport factor 2 family protein [Lacinutrix neustonica]WAC01588.1 nuclear transport factor 2 family protein [Lacinutrix neustonica]|tara:strand:- start:1310 stop:1609 length:300 start_codon:yes stop_codon:yes gene_type:complete